MHAFLFQQPNTRERNFEASEFSKLKWINYSKNYKFKPQKNYKNMKELEGGI